MQTVTFYAPAWILDASSSSMLLPLGGGAELRWREDRLPGCLGLFRAWFAPSPPDVRPRPCCLVCVQARPFHTCSVCVEWPIPIVRRTCTAGPAVFVQMPAMGTSLALRVPKVVRNCSSVGQIRRPYIGLHGPRSMVASTGLSRRVPVTVVSTPQSPTSIGVSNPTCALKGCCSSPNGVEGPPIPSHTVWAYLTDGCRCSGICDQCGMVGPSCQVAKLLGLPSQTRFWTIRNDIGHWCHPNSNPHRLAPGWRQGCQRASHPPGRHSPEAALFPASLPTSLCDFGSGPQQKGAGAQGMTDSLESAQK